MSDAETSVLALPDEDRRFPHLSAMQETFAVNYVANGGNGTKAARDAGYAKASAHVAANKLLRKPPIAEAVRELTMLLVAAHAPGALGTIARLSKRAKSEYVALEASKDLLSRVGIQAPTRHVHSGAVSINIDLT